MNIGFFAVDLQNEDHVFDCSSWKKGQGYTIMWRNLFALAVLTIIVFAACGGDEAAGAVLTIKNESFTEITDVRWNGVGHGWSILSGGSAALNVPAGSGHIYFKRKENPISARTRDAVHIDNGQKSEFTFTDNTLIVEAQNPNNGGMLGTLQSTVVWWDDGEGAMQPYYETVGVRYTQGGAIQISGKLHLRVNLLGRAKLSFGIGYYHGYGSECRFFINGERVRRWASDQAWSQVEFDLEPGQNDLIWEKVGINGALSLDDILIYYSE